MMTREAWVIKKRAKAYKDKMIRIDNIIRKNDEVLKRDYANEWVTE